jgi:ATP-binding cassette subfamily B protein
MLLFAAGGTGCSILGGYWASKTAAGFSQALRGSVFSRVESFSLREFDEIGTASLINRTTNDITHIQQVLNMMLRMFISAPMMCIGGIIMAVSKDARLSLVFVVAIPVLGIVLFLIARKGVPLFKSVQKKLDQLNLVFRESLTGFRVIRAFNRGEHERHRFHDANSDLTDLSIRVNQIMAVLMPVMMLLLNFSIISIMWLGSNRIAAGELQVGDLMAFIQYAMQIMFSLMMVTMMFVMIPRASASAVRVNEVLETRPEIVDPEAPNGAADSAGGRLEFRNVTFSYPGAERPALRNVTFSAGSGEVTAVIGGTGAGKSTLANLIPRFYDVDAGSITIDGVDVREMTQEELRSRIGFIPQKAVLFSGTVTENIRFGNEGASDEEVRQAAETAQAAAFISDLKDGYETAVSQGGGNLSGGQKQRLSVARALARKPELYVFDDSFSALDFKTDAMLRAALRKGIEDATVIIVAQRVNTIMDADRIIVLEDGETAGIGTHDELMRTCEVYREIVDSQMSEEESA